MDDHAVGHSAVLSAWFIGRYYLPSFFVDPSEGRWSVVQVPGGSVRRRLDVWDVALDVNRPQVGWRDDRQ
eukprot:7116925-Alexandrium_andersonii.AAC.1